MGSVALRLRVAAGAIAPSGDCTFERLHLRAIAPLGNCTFGNCTFGRALLSSEWSVPLECPEMRSLPIHTLSSLALTLGNWRVLLARRA